MTTSTLLRTSSHRSPDSAPSIAPAAMAPSASGWHPDPMGIHKFRWHDGTEWTGHVTHFGPVPCLHCGA